MGNVVRFPHVYRREPDAVPCRDPADTAVIIVFPVISLVDFDDFLQKFWSTFPQARL